MSSVKKCECYENRDDETGEVCENYCLSCAAADGHCECNCNCGQCLYSESPCGYKPDTPCKLCVFRASTAKIEDYTNNPLSEVSLILSNLERNGEITSAIERVTKMRTTIASQVASGLTHLQKRITGLLDPCLDALKMATDPTMAPWASLILTEVGNLIGLKGHTELRNICGIDDCTCHLRRLNSLLAKNKGVALEAQIVEAENARHYAWRGRIEAMRVLDTATLENTIANENLMDADWDTELSLRNESHKTIRDLNNKVVDTSVAMSAAKHAYNLATLTLDATSTEFYRLIELKKQVIT
jgi:hypothetical protein